MSRRNKNKRGRIVGPGTSRPPFDSETKQENTQESPVVEPKSTTESVLDHRDEQVAIPAVVESELPREWPNFDAWRVSAGLTTELLQQENTGGKLEPTVIRDPATGRILPGSALNPNGRPPGAENFKTIFEKALKQVAALNGKDPETLYVEIISKGIQQARRGDYRFFKDLMDRVHGKAKESIDLTSDGQPIAAGNQITFVNFRTPNDSDRK